MLHRFSEDELLVQWLHEPGVDDRGIRLRFLHGFERIGEDGADADDEDVLAFPQELSLADGQPDQGIIHPGSGAGAARIPQRGRAVDGCRGIEHVPQLVLVPGHHDGHVGDHPQVGDVERPVVGWPVISHQASAVESEHHRQVLDRDVVDDLVERPLEECRVDGAHRPHAGDGEARGERRGVLLRDAHVEESVGKQLLELVQPGP